MNCSLNAEMLWGWNSVSIFFISKSCVTELISLAERSIETSSAITYLHLLKSVE